MSSTSMYRPLASRHRPDRISVYIGAQYNDLPRDAALRLLVELSEALNVTLPAQQRFHAWAAGLRMLPTVDDVAERFSVSRATAYRWLTAERLERRKAAP